MQQFMQQKFYTAILLFALTTAIKPAAAQPKLAVQNQSALTGITLPEGSKQDKRMLYVSAAKMVLEPIAKKYGTTLNNTEVLYLQPLKGIKLNAASITPILQEKGWNVTIVDGQPEYLWLEQSGKHMLAFITTTKKETNFYLAEANNAPVLTAFGTSQPAAVSEVNIAPPASQTQQQPAAQTTTEPVIVSNGFTFTSTNFDDGWTSIVKENWVEVSKPGIAIRIHYPNEKTDKHNFNKLEGDNNAWNILTAPRYTSITNFLERGIQDYQSVTFLTADATDQSGKNVHIVLYKKHYDKGNGRYMEVVADSKAIFEKEFGSRYINRSSWDYLEQVKSWDKLADMQWRNKFAMAAADLYGKWGASDYASLSYYYVNTGGFAGATATSLSDQFTFLQSDKYESDHSGASGVVGNQKFSRQVYKGSAAITNWNISLTNRFQGETEKYDCYFEAVKGGRILIMRDRLGYTLTLIKSK